MIPTMKIKIIVIALLLAINLGENIASGNELPELGDDSQTVLTPLEEKAIGEQILRQVASSDDVIEDSEITDYLQVLGERLIANTSNKQQKFKFFLLKDNTINAFAMPGGVIGVHTGLILATNSESELASVLGHEIGHVTQHHLARMLASQKYDIFKNIGGIALALLVARSNPQLAGGALTTATAIGVQSQLDYSREYESEADRIGLQLLDSGGFDVRGMPSFFKTLQRGTRFSEGSAPSFLRTHPLTTERIADITNRVEQIPYRQVNDSIEFQYVRAKIQSENGLVQNAIDVFEQNIRDHVHINEEADHYGLGVAYLRKNSLNKAEEQVAWLNQNAPKHAMIENLKARLLVAENNPPKAEKQYEAGLKLFPDSRALIYGYVEHFVAVGQPDNAVSVLKEKQNLYPDDAKLYELLAKSYTMKNKVLLSHQAQGEAYYRKYDLKHAIEQMELAVKANDGDFYQKSIVEARLQVLRRMLSDEKKAKNAT